MQVRLRESEIKIDAHTGRQTDRETDRQTIPYLVRVFVIQFYM